MLSRASESRVICSHMHSNKLFSHQYKVSESGQVTKKTFVHYVIDLSELPEDSYWGSKNNRKLSFKTGQDGILSH